MALMVLGTGLVLYLTDAQLDVPRRGVVAVLGLLAFALALASAVVSAIVVRGGLVFRLVGLALVTRSGRQAGRFRSLCRALVAWSPGVLWMASLGRDPVTRAMEGQMPTLVGLGVALGVVAVGAGWSIVRPNRGPHDMVCGTWVVPR